MLCIHSLWSITSPLPEITDSLFPSLVFLYINYLNYSIFSLCRYSFRGACKYFGFRLTNFFNTVYIVFSDLKFVQILGVFTFSFLFTVFFTCSYTCPSTVFVFSVYHLFTYEYYSRTFKSVQTTKTTPPPPHQGSVTTSTFPHCHRWTTRSVLLCTSKQQHLLMVKRLSVKPTWTVLEPFSVWEATTDL